MDRPCYQNIWIAFAKEKQIEKRTHGDQKKRYKDTLKAFLKDSRGNRLHRLEQSGEIYKKGVGVQQKESAKPSRNVLSGKPEVRHH